MRKRLSQNCFVRNKMNMGKVIEREVMHPRLLLTGLLLYDLLRNEVINGHENKERE